MVVGAGQALRAAPVNAVDPSAVASYAVDTGELLATAERLHAAAAAAAAHRAVLDDLVGGVDGWSAQRSRTAATAFLATLTWAAGGASSGLSDLARRTASAAGAYDRTEGAVPLPR